MLSWEEFEEKEVKPVKAEAQGKQFGEKADMILEEIKSMASAVASTGANSNKRSLEPPAADGSQPNVRRL